MKKYIISAAVILLSLCLFACGQQKKNMSEIFDEKPAGTQSLSNKDSGTKQKNTGSSEDKKETSTESDTALAGEEKKEDVKPPEENRNETPENDSTSGENKENTGSDVPQGDNADPGITAGTSQKTDTSEDTQSSVTPVPEKFTLSDAEIQNIKSRYIEAEDFYYTMLYQHYDLDSYDVIEKKNSDGYSNEYRRVLYYDVNSLADLKSVYGDYFTADFVSKIDFNSYIEENGKLYCTETENSASSSGTKHIYTIESIDENNAYIVRTLADGSSMQKIKAVKNGGVWYFGGVAIG